MEHVLLTPDQLNLMLIDAAKKGAMLGIEAMRTEAEKEAQKPVSITALADQYNLKPKTLLKRIRERGVRKLSLRPVTIRKCDIETVIAA